MGDDHPFEDDAPEENIPSGRHARLPLRRSPPQASSLRDDLRGEHIPRPTEWYDDADEYGLVDVPLSTAWTTPDVPIAQPTRSRWDWWPSLRLQVVSPAARIAMVGLLGSALFITGGGLPEGGNVAPGDDGASLAALAEIGPATKANSARATRVAEKIKAAAVARRRHDMAVQRQREQARRDARRAARERAAKAAAAVVAAPRTQAPAPTPQAEPTPVIDPWAGVSPMERQTTPGPWNNGGS
jgi:hypothetical protein